MEESRKQFETWICRITISELRRKMILARHSNGVYKVLKTEDMWQAWQAAIREVGITVKGEGDEANANDS